MGEEILTKFENRSALAQDLNLLSGILVLYIYLYYICMRLCFYCILL